MFFIFTIILQDKRGITFTPYITLTIISAIALLIFYSVLAATERAFSSSSIIKLSSLYKQGIKKAKTVLLLKQKENETLVGILVLINITAMIYSTIVTIFTIKMFGVNHTLISVLISTLVISLLSEVLPKVLISGKEEIFIIKVSSLLNFLLKIIHPLSFIFSSISSKIAILFIKNKRIDNEIEESDIKDVAYNGYNDGVIEKNTESLLMEAFDFDRIKVQDVMTNWNKTITISKGEKCEEILKKIKLYSYSRFPVTDKNNNVIGILNSNMFLRRYFINKKMINIKNCITRPFFVDEYEDIDEILKLLKNNKIHMAVVHKIDENYNRTIIGIITVEDIIEELVGEIEDEDDLKNKMRKRNNK